MSQKILHSDDVPHPTQTVQIRLRELLDAHPDVTQTALATAVGQHHSFVSKVLAGKRRVNDLEDLVKIARFFRVSVGWLIGETPRGQDSMIEAIILAARELSLAHQNIVLAVAESLRAATPPTTGGVPPSGSTNRPRSPR